jgi:uncharacterized membrane protein
MSTKTRVIAVDAIRGVAIAGVVLFHFVWDIEFAGFISGIANHPLWLAFGRSLAGSFMILVGVSLVLAAQKGFHPARYLGRLLKIVLAAVTITAVTWFAFPATFIYFGILHAIAAATLIGTLFLRTPALVCLLAGIVVFLVPMLWQSAIFDTRWLAWIGFAQRVPPSYDFVPIFPWVGLTLIGVGAAKWLLSGRQVAILDRLIPDGQSSRALAWMGRRSLVIYLLHQPVLLSVIVPLSWLVQL